MIDIRETDADSYAGILLKEGSKNVSSFLCVYIVHVDLRMKRSRADAVFFFADKKTLLCLQISLRRILLFPLQFRIFSMKKIKSESSRLILNDCDKFPYLRSLVLN